MQEVFLAVQQAEEHERTVTRQQKLLVAVNRLLSFSAKQVPVLTVRMASITSEISRSTCT